jgi:hypothetical protein
MPRPCRFTPGNRPVPIVQEAVWASGAVWTGFDPRTFQPVASRNTDCARYWLDVRLGGRCGEEKYILILNKGEIVSMHVMKVSAGSRG